MHMPCNMHMHMHMHMHMDMHMDMDMDMHMCLHHSLPLAWRTGTDERGMVDYSACTKMLRACELSKQLD